MQKTERNAEICQIYQDDSSVTLTQLAIKYGITRERVRQIIDAAGLESRTERTERKLRQISTGIKRKKLTVSEASAQYGVQRGTVLAAVRRFGVEPRVKTAADYKYGSPEIVEMAEKVKAGMSLRQASGENHAVEALLARYCKAHNIVSRHGRWRDRSMRAALIERMRKERATWEHIARMVSVTEGKHVGPVALGVWWKSYQTRQKSS